MSELLVNARGLAAILSTTGRASHAEINAYFDGARGGVRLYAVWQDGDQFVGSGRPLKDALQDIENMRQTALAKSPSDD